MFISFPKGISVADMKVKVQICNLPPFWNHWHSAGAASHAAASFIPPLWRLSFVASALVELASAGRDQGR